MFTDNLSATSWNCLKHKSHAILFFKKCHLRYFGQFSGWDKLSRYPVCGAALDDAHIVLDSSVFGSKTYGSL